MRAEGRGQVDQADRLGDHRRAWPRPTGPGATPGAGASGASTWYGPLNSRPKSPWSSPWSVVKTTSTSSSQPRAAMPAQHPAERLVDELALHRVAGVDLAHLVGGQRGRHPLGGRLVVRHQRRRRTRGASAGAWRRGSAPRSARARGSRRAAATSRQSMRPTSDCGGSHGWWGSGKLIQQNQSSSASSESSQAIVRSATQSVWYQPALDGVDLHLGRAGVAPARGVDLERVRRGRGRSRRPPRGARPRSQRA